jgi:hypothetical protein
MTFKRPPARPAKQYQGAKPAAPRRQAEGSPELMRALDSLMRDDAPPLAVRAPRARRDPDELWGDKIRQAARGKDCTVRLVGVCTHDPEKSIWSHGRWGARLGSAGRGMATKALDLCGAIACTACDAVFDGQAPLPAHLTREQVDLDWCFGHFRSMGVLHEMGLL